MMLKKMLLLSAVAVAAGLIGGCSSVQTAGVDKLNGQKLSASATDVAHISTHSAGLYFLWIPLLTGSTQDVGSIVFGEDSVNATALTKALTLKSKELGATKTVDIVSMKGSTMLIGPIPFLFYWKTATVSGNAVK